MLHGPRRSHRGRSRPSAQDQGTSDAHSPAVQLGQVVRRLQCEQDSDAVSGDLVSDVVAITPGAEEGGSAS